ncbi:MAG: glycosyltransferase family 4 protein [Porticoccaceae bacterium]
MKNLKVLLVHRYFWPDSPPYAAMLKCIAEDLAREGKDVTVFSTQPSYKKNISKSDQVHIETINGVKIIRKKVWGYDSNNMLYRIYNTVIFLVKLAVHILISPRYDIVMMSTVPQVVGPFVAAVVARSKGARFFYHCQDIHPEAAKFGGLVKSNILFGLLMALDKATMVLASKVIVLSDDMKLTLVNRLPGIATKISVINNFELPDFSYITEDFLTLAPKGYKFRVLFAGNVGNFQGLDLLIDAMVNLKDISEIELVILGDGNAKSLLEEKVVELRLDNVSFFGHQKLGVAKAMIREADLCLVTLAPEIYRCAFPSKAITILAQGTPLLVCVEKESSLAAMVLDNNLGYHCEMRDSQEVSDRLLAAYLEAGRDGELRHKCTQFYNANFRTDIVLKYWSKLVV